MIEDDLAEGKRSSSPTTVSFSDTSNGAVTPKLPSLAARDDSSCCVQVAVRVRPLLLALESEDANCMEVQRHPGCCADHAIAIQVGGTGGPRFTFDHVFDMHAPQQQIYTERVAPLVVSCLQGYNATILAYGQTGSGKTHTIMGPNPTSAAITQDDDTDAGVIPRAFTAIFASLAEKKIAQSKVGADLDYQVSVQFLELYGEEIRDLLTASRTEKLTIRDLGTDEPEVVGATQTRVQTASEALDCLAHGVLRRVTGATAMNESSSRSHAILSVCIEQSIVYKISGDSATSSDDCSNEEQVQVTRSKFNFVDLAGAERQKRTGATGKRLQEGIDINKGLSNLGNVISALGDPKKRGRTHVPYRDAKLTRLLKGSLGGNHKTLMIACVSPAAANMGESLNCLRYANRAKNIQNKAVVNVDANTRLVQELQGQVKALALDLLKALDGDVRTHFTREALVAIVDGTVGSIPMSPTTSTPNRVIGDVDFRLKAAENALRETQGLLRQTQNYQDAAELELHTVRARNSVCEAHVTALTQDRNNGQVCPDAVERAFAEKAVAYEKEIRNLQRALRESDKTIQWNSEGVDLDDDHDNDILEHEEKVLGENRDRLMSIRAAISLDDENETSYFSACDFDLNASTLLNSEQFEAEEKEEQSELDSLTNKYLKQGGHADEDAVENHSDSNKVGMPTFDQRAKHFTVDLEELSQSIEMKERLISQIKSNKKREAMMRMFYEAKLTELKHALEEKESERDQLVRELQLAEERSSSSEELKSRLQEKQEQIEALRKMQTNYKKHTGEASRNSADIARLSQLQDDVKNMKRRKADMQKELAYEKRHHAKEVNKLNKMVVQKDKEINKIRKISNQSLTDAEKAKAISKVRLEELSQLKKALRSYKRGVGLDPVLVGRRQTRNRGKGELLMNDKGFGSKMSTIDIDSMRDYFDKKVACVVQKEAIVDKLSKEWEEYFKLNTRLKDISSNPEEDSSETRETLEVKIRFKNDKIRKLAQRSRRQELPREPSSGGSPSPNDSFLFDSEFSKLCEECTPDLAQSTVARVLFGMIVRERRRVATLVKTASSLDEKVQSAEKASAVSEAALRSYMDEHRMEVADLERKQQDHIISLMHMVNEDSDRIGPRIVDKSKVITANSSEEKFQKKLLVLANERVAVLERQVSELRSENAGLEEYELKVNELNNLLSAKAKACDWLERERNDLRTAIRQIRDEAARHAIEHGNTSNTDIGSIIVTMADHFLHPVSGSFHEETTAISGLGPSPRRKLDKVDRNHLTPRFKKHIELMHSSDSGSDSGSDDDVDPEWATNIMADLALIAEGIVPPSLNSSVVLAGASKLEEDSVFDRLANPRSFTGTQKHTRNRRQAAEVCLEETPPSQADVSEKNVRLDEGHTECSGLVAVHASTLTELDNDATPKAAVVGDVLSSDIDKQAYQSVFDRLGSPSQFTGTQKEKFHETRAKRDRAAEEVAERVLCGILDETKNQLQEKSLATSVRSEYTKLNVFDRLQKTTTHAAAIRQNETLHVDARASADLKVQDSPTSSVNGASDLLQPETSVTIGPETHPRGENGDESRAGLDRTAYTKQNVFDRLQKTSTLAAAVRQSETLNLVETKAHVSPVTAGDKLLAPAQKQTSSDYKKQNVFERLNKTTTEAYAKKSNRTNKGD